MVAPITLLRHLRAGYRRHPDVDLYHINWLQTALPLPADGKPALVTGLGNDLNLLRLPFVRPLLRPVFSRFRLAFRPNATELQAPLTAPFSQACEVGHVPFG